MVVERCAFETGRLVVEDWHRVASEQLAGAVAEMLTPAVTRALPPDWSGAYDLARARRWISERDAEGSTLLVSEGAVPVGLVLLHEEPVADGVVVRLGYLLSEGAWGRGLGGELLAGLVGWCRGQPAVRALVGGVAADNAASIGILERNGFSRDDHGPARPELQYRLTFDR